MHFNFIVNFLSCLYYGSKSTIQQTAYCCQFCKQMYVLICLNFRQKRNKENKNDLKLKRTNDWNRNPVPCLTMYKRNITNIEEHGLEQVQAKKPKKEPLTAITGMLTNDKNLNEKGFDVACKTIEKIENDNTSVEKMDSENVISQEPKIEHNFALNAKFQALKYNSICDRDRRRHMYF